MPTRRDMLALLTFAPVAALAACARNAEQPPEVGGAVPPTSPTPPSALLQTEQTPRPVNAIEPGLDLIWFGVRDPSSRATARVFADAAPAVFVDSGGASLWERNGIRAFVMTDAAADALVPNFERVGSEKRTQLPEAQRWTPLLAGSGWVGDRTIQMHDGRLVISSGRLRMLARFWWEPTIMGGELRTRLRLEIVIQHEIRRAVQPSLTMPGVDDQSEEARGPILWSVAAGLALAAGESLVLVPESPARDWARVRATETAPRPEIREPDLAGPAAPPLLSLCEAMLTDGMERPEPDIRIIAILRPRAAAR
jgi:hypothetical protein